MAHQPTFLETAFFTVLLSLIAAPYAAFLSSFVW